MQKGSYKTHLKMLFKRTAALVYDSLAVIALWMLGTAIILPFHHGLAFPTHSYIYQMYLLLLAYLFFVGFWTHGGQTIGMMAWRLRIISVSTQPMTLKQANLRFVGLVLSFLSFPITTLSVLFNRPIGHLQDKISSTSCVQN